MMNPAWLMLFIPLVAFGVIFFRMEEKRKRDEAAAAEADKLAWVHHCLKTGDWR